MDPGGGGLDVCRCAAGVPSKASRADVPNGGAPTHWRLKTWHWSNQPLAIGWACWFSANAFASE